MTNTATTDTERQVMDMRGAPRVGIQGARLRLAIMLLPLMGCRLTIADICPDDDES